MQNNGGGSQNSRIKTYTPEPSSTRWFGPCPWCPYFATIRRLSCRAADRRQPVGPLERYTASTAVSGQAEEDELIRELSKSGVKFTVAKSLKDLVLKKK